jgi:aerobic carbon-monoxide dehydrogenase small subunit
MTSSSDSRRTKMKRLINITVNQKKYELAVDPNMTLADMIREELKLTGTKKGCGLGECGACTVLLDGKPVSSCIVLAVEADKRDVVTIEGVETEKGLHPIQQAFVEKGAIQCGFCTPGMVLSAKALLDENPHPDEQDIRKAISGNLCRCTGYQKIVEAVQSVSARK